MADQEKVILWGTGKIFQQYYSEIREIADAGHINIQALVSRDAKEKAIDGLPVIRMEFISEYAFDKIIIMATAQAAASILEDACALNIEREKLINVFSYLIASGAAYSASKEYQAVVNRQINVLRKLLQASDADVKDYAKMRRLINEYGVYDFGRKERGVNYTQWGILQVIDEFAAYCNYIADLQVHTAIEIGVAQGRSSYFMCALLSRQNPDLQYFLVDIYDSLDSYEQFKNILPALEKRIPSTSLDYKAQSFDFAFIDADHSYDASMQDFYNVGQYARKLTVFHDIYAHEYDELNGGTVRTWQEVVEQTKEKEHKVFSKYPNQWMGIGCVVQ